MILSLLTVLCLIFLLLHFLSCYWQISKFIYFIFVLRYTEVITACSLNQDLHIFPHGDQTEVSFCFWNNISMYVYTFNVCVYNKIFNNIFCRKSKTEFYEVYYQLKFLLLRLISYCAFFSREHIHNVVVLGLGRRKK